MYKYSRIFYFDTGRLNIRTIYRKKYFSILQDYVYLNKKNYFNYFLAFYWFLFTVLLSHYKNVLPAICARVAISCFKLHKGYVLNCCYLSTYFSTLKVRVLVHQIIQRLLDIKLNRYWLFYRTFHWIQCSPWNYVILQAYVIFLKKVAKTRENFQ